MTEDQLREIEARHERCSFVVTKTEWNEREAFNAHTDRAALVEEVRLLREALAPFAQFYKSMTAGWSHSVVAGKNEDETWMGALPGPEVAHNEPYARITFGDLRRARNALGEDGRG